MRRRLQRLRDRGETLIELVVALGVLGVCVIAIGTTVALSVKVSSVHRFQATAQAFLHNYAETIQGTYTACSGGVAPNYVSIDSLAAPNAGFNAPSATVKFWDPATSSFDLTSCPATDPGLQQVTLTLSTPDGTVNEALETVVRSTSLLTSAGSAIRASPWWSSCSCSRFSASSRFRSATS